MKRSWSMHLCLASIVAILAQLSYIAPQTQMVSSDFIQKEGYLPAPALAGNVFDDPTEQPFVIFLPATYNDSSNQYPVIYFLHGFSQIAYDYQSIFLSIQPPMEVIIVVVHGHSTVGGSFYENSPVTGSWEDYLVQNVVSYIDTHFRTIPQPESRGIAGLSMGGYSALNIAMKHPDVFGSTYAISPGLFAPDGILDSQMGEESNIEYVLDLIAQLRLMADLDLSAAHNEYLSVLNSLSNGDSKRFVLAYGSAFAPNIGNGPPYFDFLYVNNSGAIEPDNSVWSDWESGFGGIEEEVSLYQDNLTRLNGIGIEFSQNDQYTWIPDGCTFFSSLLQNRSILHTLHETAYGHADRLITRINQFMMPFFNSTLSSEVLITPSSTEPSEVVDFSIYLVVLGFVSVIGIILLMKRWHH